VCFCSAGGGAPGTARTSPTKWRTGQETRRRCEGPRAQQDEGSELWPHGMEEVGGPGAQAGRGPQQQNLEAEDARLGLMPLPSSPLVFPKAQGEKTNFLKSTNLLVPSWGSLPHRTQANKAAVSTQSRARAAGPGCSTGSHPAGPRVPGKLRPSQPDSGHRDSSRQRNPLSLGCATQRGDGWG